MDKTIHHRGRFHASLSKNQQIELLLAILSNLRRYEVVSIADLAAQLSMPIDTLRDELEHLLYIGIPPFGGGDLLPIELDEDDMICVTGDMPALNHQLRLSEEEVQALTIATLMAGFASTDELPKKLSAAFANNFNAQTLDQIIHIVDAGHSQDIFQTLTLAISNGHCLHIENQNQLEQKSKRIVEPNALFAEGDAWYLDGFDHMTKQQRTFRLDRILAAEIVHDQSLNRDIVKHGQAPPEAAFNIAKMSKSCRLRFEPAAAFRPSEWPGAVRRQSTGSGATVDVSYAEPDWIAHKVVALHGLAKVLFPEEVKEAVKRRAVTKRRELESRLQESADT